jgi:hypothetical protein
MNVLRLPAGAVAALLATGCGPGRPPVGPTALDRAADAICAATDAARRGDLGEAERVFEDRAHASLHDLAERAARRDRAAAGQLLQAKQRVEAAFAAEADPEELADLLIALRSKMVEAGRSIGTRLAPECVASA